MAKQPYITNWMDAVCTECNAPCEPIYDDGKVRFNGPLGDGQTHNFGESWDSDCCSAPMVDENGNEWIAEPDDRETEDD